MQVGPAILIEFTAPAAVVVWLWLRHGQRPGRMTLVGAGLAALGLVLVLDLVSGADLSLPGVLWALAAMVGCATYFIISADEDNGLPPLVLAWGGLVVGAVALGAARRWSACCRCGRRRPPRRTPACEVAWWVPLVVLGLVTAALAYVTGIAAGRRLGSRLASFVALLEVVASVCWAWLLLHELPRAVQLLGGLLILAGVVAVKLGERSVVVRVRAQLRALQSFGLGGTGGLMGDAATARTVSQHLEHGSGAGRSRARWCWSCSPASRPPTSCATTRRSWPTSWSRMRWLTVEPTPTAPSSSSVRSSTSAGRRVRDAGRTGRSSRGRWSRKPAGAAAWPSSTH